MILTLIAPQMMRVCADEPLRPVRSSFMLEGGSSHILDTYLSPLKYTGWQAGFAYERTQAMKFSPERWRQRLELSVQIGHADNPARNASLIYPELGACWGMSRLWSLPCGVYFTAGGAGGGNLGVIYSTRNGNNPVSVKADIYVGATGSVGYKIPLRKLPLTLRWQTTLPLTGVFFSPQYDELYYEISLGNRHGLAHWAWPGNMFRWDNLVTADLGFGNTTLRVGMRSRIYSTEVNHITTRCFSYTFVLGIVTDWLSVSPRHPLTDREMQWAY